MLIRKRRILQFVLAGLIVLVCGAAWVVYHNLSRALAGERCLDASLLVVAVLRDYVVISDGSWPRSWSELERMPARQHSMYRWPTDAAIVRQYVWVDFDADLDKMAAQSRDEFDAVKPIGPCYPFKHHGQVDELLDTIRQLRAKNPEGATRPVSTSPAR